MAITVTNNPIILNVTAIAGDTLDNWSITFTGIDISTYSFYYVVKKSFSKLDADAEIIKAPGDAVKTDSGSGIVDTLAFPLLPADTEVAPGKYKHAIKFVDGSIERTWVEGDIEFVQRRIDTV